MKEWQSATERATYELAAWLRLVERPCGCKLEVRAEVSGRVECVACGRAFRVKR